jgi:uracil-DNA glycosylase
LTEYQSGDPFSGAAGKIVRELFAECGCDGRTFEQLVHTSAVVKCFPGSKLAKRRSGAVRREDLKPCRAMQKNCRPFLETQLRIVNPALVVLLGSLALETYVELKSGRRQKVVLGDYVGQVDRWGDKRIVALAHTSGGSYWLNDPINQARQARAKEHLSAEFARLRSGAALGGSGETAGASAVK